jgi:hypothetical protein
MTGEGLLDIIIAHCDKNSSDSSYRALALKWLNLIVKDIQSRQDGFHWRFLETTEDFDTVVDQFEYDFGTILTATIDTTKVVHVYEKTNDVTLKYVPYERFRELVADETEDTGEPSTVFTLFKSRLMLFPVPSAVITHYIDFISIMGDVSDDTTELSIPDKYQKVVIDGILTYAYQFDPELGDRTAQEVIYENGMARMIRENRSVIAEDMMPVSHRERHGRKRSIDGRLSLLFPLDNTSM